MQVRANASAFAKDSTPEALFDRVADPDAAQDFFQGFGPIPAILSVRITSEGPIAAGTRREVRLADGSAVREEIIEFQRPEIHRYRILGFQPPLSHWICEGTGSWSFRPERGGARVTWNYEYKVASIWAWPMAALFAKVLMRTAMRRAVRHLATHQATASASQSNPTN